MRMGLVVLLRPIVSLLKGVQCSYTRDEDYTNFSLISITDSTV